MKPGDVDWEKIFGEIAYVGFTRVEFLRPYPKRQLRLLSKLLPHIQKARNNCVLRSQLSSEPLKSIGGLEKAREVNREIAKHVDVMISNRRRRFYSVAGV